MSLGEDFWRHNYPFLTEYGYQLRDKYKPGWKPSWKNEKERSNDPDAALGAKSSLCDAVRKSDGKLLMLKRVSFIKHPQEISMALYLASLPSGNPQNYTVPVVDVLDPPAFPDEQIMVMPRLHPFDEPPFDTVGEFLDAIRQILEGMHFMHANFVAHRDLHWGNVMIDASRLIPKGTHPASLFMSPDFKRFAKYGTRTACWPRHYIIDFGLSHRYLPDTIPFETHFPTPGRPLLPECNTDSAIRYNPFPADIYRLGFMLRFYFQVGKFAPLEFLTQLVDDMTREEPSSRPVITEVRRRFLETCSKLTSTQLRRPGCSDTEMLQGYRQLKHKIMFRDPLPSNFFAPTDLSFDESLRPFYTSTPPS